MCQKTDKEKLMLEKEITIMQACKIRKISKKIHELEDVIAKANDIVNEIKYEI